MGPVQAAVLEVGGSDKTTGDVVELQVDGTDAIAVEEVEIEVNGSAGLVELTLALLSLNKDESTLSTELVSFQVPGVIVGVVPAKLIVGEVVRPRAPLSAVLTALEVLIAGMTEDRILVVVGKAPDAA